MSQLVYERMRDALEQRNMPRALENVDALLDRVGNNELSVVELLDQLLGAELGARRERSITMRLTLLAPEANAAERDGVVRPAVGAGFS